MGLTDTDRAALRRMKSDFHMDARVIVPDLLPRLHQVLLPDDMSRVEHRGNTVGWASAANQMLDIYEARANNLNPLVAALDNVNLGKMADKLRTIAAIKIELITLDDDEQGSKPDGQFSGDVRPEAVKDSDSCDAQMPELPSRLRPRCHLSPGPSTSGETPPGNQQNQETEISDIRLRTVSPASTATSGGGDKDNTENQTPTTQRAEDDPASGSRGQNSDTNALTPRRSRRCKGTVDYREKFVDEDDKVRPPSPSYSSESGGETRSSNDGSDDTNPHQPDTNSKKKPNKNSSTGRKQLVPAGEKRYKCSECGKAFRRKDSLKTHARIHSGERPFECKECGKAFTQRSHLISHQGVHSGERPYECIECGKAFGRKDNLIAHARTHREERPFACKVCDKTFAWKQSLATHQRTHSGKKPYKCEHCPKRFALNCARIAHERTHTGERPFVCKKCGKSYTQLTNLITHQRIHSGEKPFKCTKCGKRFTNSTSLKIHELTHTGEKPFNCTKCGKKFSQSSDLKKHDRTHTGEKPFECPECGKKFNQSSNLKAHRRIHKKI